MKYFVAGHQSPDTDSVISAITFSLYLKKSGINAEPVIVGKPNRETKFILNHVKEKVPKSMMKASANGKFYLVDHGGVEQAIEGLKEENIVGVIDHHQMMELNTAEPILYRCEVIGSTSTLIAKMFNEKGWKLNKKTASLLAAGIISDTLNLTSKTTTNDDKKILKELSRLAEINVKDFSKKMFEAKSDMSGMDLKKILLNDFKEYDHKGKKLGVGVFETVDAGPFNEKKDKVFDLLKEIKKEKGFDLLFFGSVDIMKKKTFFYLIDDKESEVAKKAFNLPAGKGAGEIVILKDVTSRKKQVVPFLFKSI